MIQALEIWEARDGYKWLVLPNDDYRSDCFRAVSESGEILLFWQSGKVAYRYCDSREDLIRMSEDQSIAIFLNAVRQVQRVVN